MPNLNQAFIKAFDKSQARAPAGTAARSNQANRPDATAEASSAALSRGDKRIDKPQTHAPAIDKTSAADKSGITPGIAASAVLPVRDAQPAPAATPTTAPKAIFDPPHAAVRAPFANFADPPPTPRSASEIAPRASTPAPDATTANTLSSRTPATVETPPAPVPPVILPIGGATTAWRPVFEVANFAWPDLTDMLLEAAPEQFRAAALELIEASRRHRKLVALTAAHRGEGCTAVVLALAKALAHENQRVTIVDAHFDAPGLADQLGVVVQTGWEEPLAGEKPLVEALIESLEDHLTVLPLRAPAAEDWRLSIARLKASFDELRRNCDLVLIDAGPLGVATDRRRLLSWAAPCRVDRALVVRDLRSTTDNETAEIEQRLHGCGVAQWNFVENFFAA